MAVRIHCREVGKRFGATVVLDRVDWVVDTEATCGLVGRSGAGKTTLLRILAGLDAPSSGEIQIEPLDGGPSSGRIRVGMMFQDLALWPHLTVRQHLMCVLWSLPRRERIREAEAAFSAVRLPVAVWSRRPSQLSGGEAQRLALARALAPRPELLLLDEPLAHVDAPMRSELLGLIREVIASRRTTAVYVTHRWSEAAELCQRIAVIDDGRIVADADPHEMFWRPASVQIARLTGPLVEFPLQWLTDGRIAAEGDAEGAAGGLCREGEMVYVRPQQLQWVEPCGLNRWEPVECRPEGSAWHVVLAGDGGRLSTVSSQPVRLHHPVGVELKTCWGR